MGVRWATALTLTRITTVLANGAETLFLTTPPINLAIDGAIVQLFWTCNFTTGAANTAIAINLYRGTSTAGLQIQNVQNAQGAAVSGAMSGCMFDATAGIAAGLQYSLSIIPTGATGAGNIGPSNLMAIVL